MFDADLAIGTLVLLLILVFAGFHVAIALGVTAVVGMFATFYGRTGNADRAYTIVENAVAGTFYDAIREYVIAVVPLFMLMGEFAARSGAIRDLYTGLQRSLPGVRGRLALATLFGNAIFSFVTGVSIASATTFTRMAYPEMKRHRYSDSFSLGVIAGSGCLGMLIPPSVLLIIWGILTEQSIGDLFLAGVLPGLILVAMMAVYIVAASYAKGELVGEGVAARPAGADVTPRDAAAALEEERSVSRIDMTVSLIGTVVLIVSVLGGIWGGLFTPTEGAGVGALIALALAVVKGQGVRDIYEGILSVGRTAAPLLILLITAQLYSRSLTLTGVNNFVSEIFTGAGFEAWQAVAFMVLVWFLLGMIVDSVSIMLITVPIFGPLAVGVYQLDPVAFAIMGILAIEAGILTPPFGLLVYTVKAMLPADSGITLGTIFKGSTPYWVLLLALIILLFIYPEIATVLPDWVQSLRQT